MGKAAANKSILLCYVARRFILRLKELIRFMNFKEFIGDWVLGDRIFIYYAVCIIAVTTHAQMTNSLP